MENNQNTGAGKGDKPRNCFSKKYRDNYDSIEWCNKKLKELHVERFYYEKNINTGSFYWLPES
jgi:hypothetical protein